MPRNHDCCHILRLAAAYRRVFSGLILNIELVNLVEVDKTVPLTTKIYPVILLLLFATMVAITGINLQIFLPNTLPLSEFLTMCFLFSSKFVAVAIPLIQSMFNYREIHFFWCKIYETTRFAFDELGYEISFRYFWKRFLTSTVVCVVTSAIHATIRFWFHSWKSATGTQFCAFLQQSIILYIVVHALFIVNLNSFFIRLLIKYIDLDYRNRVSNLDTGREERPLLAQLKLYKQFHYKLWEMTIAVNNFFGITLLVLSYHSFVDITNAAYYIFLYISRRDPALILIRNFHLYVCIFTCFSF